MTQTQSALSAPPTGVEVIPVLDFGAQYVQLIARRVREAGAYSMLVAPDVPLEELRALNPRGIILSGGPASVSGADAPRCDPRLFDLGVPVLGICYGMQLGCEMLGAQVQAVEAREFGRARLSIRTRGGLLDGLPSNTAVWMSHGDQVTRLPDSFEALASTETCPLAVVRHREVPFYGVQFHPEVTHTPHGVDLLRNFLYEICRCQGTWRMTDFLESESRRVQEIVGDDRVICGLSGGVDSSVVAALLARAIGAQLTCIFVDNGLLRKKERDLVERTFRDHFDIDLRVVDAADAFLGDLAGVTDPQEKRKRIGHRFIEVFKEAAAEIGSARGDPRFLAQGTLYPDVIESGHGYAGASANIKLHHNVGGLPEDLGFELIEPLRDLFKDEVRKLGEVLGLPAQIVWRHPFPGPGLAVRVLGAITREKLDLIRDCDEILLEEIIANNLYRSTDQVFAVLLPIQSVGVMGDGRTYEAVVAIRAVETQDFMTADWARIPFDVLATISSRIINEVTGVNRVVYDISSKPPATIEWEKGAPLQGEMARARQAIAAGRHGEAREICTRALKRNRRDLDALELLGILERDLGEYDSALKHFERCAKLSPGQVKFEYFRACVLADQGRSRDAIARFDKVLAKEGGTPMFALSAAAAYERVGERGRALDILQPFIDDGRATAMMSGLHARLLASGGDEAGRAAAVDALRARLAGELSSGERQMLLFTLGKIYEQAGEWDLQFEACAAANEIDKPPFDEDAHRAAVDALCATFSRAALADVPVARDATELPVFVAGLPRTGTTLVEQIIDAHPLGHGAGELIQVTQLVERLQVELDAYEPYPQCALTLDEAAAGRLARPYLALLRSRSRRASRVVNKALDNIEHVGLISRLWPGARVVFCRRDPRDACVSCFLSPLIAARLRYVTDLRALGLVSRRFDRLVRHWRDALDLKMHEVQYETMIDEQEPRTRDLIAFCGLEWDDRCLRFHESGRTVMTLSYDQVSRPIYRSSVGRWKRYEKHLGPLLEALDAD